VSERVLTLAAMLLTSNTNANPTMTARRVAQSNNFTGFSPEELVSNNVYTALLGCKNLANRPGRAVVRATIR
jgi:hypothetical protein